MPALQRGAARAEERLFNAFGCPPAVCPPERPRPFTHYRQKCEVCDPGCLLQGPETSKVPKVVRRGCKRCFGPGEQRSPKSLLHHPNPVLHLCNSLLHQCKRTLALWAQKTFCTLSKPLWALLRFRASVAGTQGRNAR